MDFSRLTGFDWDDATRDKNLIQQRMRWTETEEVFFHRPLLVYPDPQPRRCAGWRRPCSFLEYTYSCFMLIPKINQNTQVRVVTMAMGSGNHNEIIASRE